MKLNRFATTFALTALTAVSGTTLAATYENEPGRPSDSGSAGMSAEYNGPSDNAATIEPRGGAHVLTETGIQAFDPWEQARGKAAYGTPSEAMPAYVDGNAAYKQALPGD